MFKIRGDTCFISVHLSMTQMRVEEALVLKLEHYVLEKVLLKFISLNE